MIYLDHAATALQRPPEVAAAVLQAMQQLGNPGRGAHAPSLNAARLVYDTRCKLAALFHVSDPSRIAFCANATAALNLAISGLLQPGDHAVTTACAHNSVLRPLYRTREKGTVLTIVPADRQGIVSLDALAEAVTPGTRLVVIPHASNVTGNTMPLRQAADIAHAAGALLVVDAAQSAGHLPIDAEAMEIDVLCFTGHKGLMGPQGTGGLYVRPGLDIAPLMVGGSGIHSYDTLHPAQMPEALEAGTLNVHGLAGLNAAVSQLLTHTDDPAHAAASCFAERVNRIPGVTVYGDLSASERAPVVSLNINGLTAAQAADILWEEYGICVRAGAHCAPLMHQALGTAPDGTVRFSFGHFSTMEDAIAAAGAVVELSEEACESRSPTSC